MTNLIRKLHRRQHLAENVVFVDGISGCGKSMISPVLSSLQRGELWMLNHIFEYSLIMHSLGLMSLDATETMIKMFIDHDSYNLMIGRNINTRSSDDSSIQKNKMYEIYQKRINEPDGDIIIDKMKKEKPINFFMTHYILNESKPLFSALKERLKLFIVPVRHPYWTIENWINQDWSNKMGSHPRDLAMVYEFNKNFYPWHVKDWEEKYDQLNNFERAIETINHLSVDQSKLDKNFSVTQKEKIMIISFEKFAIDPKNYLESINKILDTEPTSETKSVMTSMDLPRKIDPSVFTLKRSEILEKANKEKISSHYMDLLIHLADEYENEYLQEVL